MPFKKLRLRKTRHYNVLSRNVLVLSVELIDKTPIECTLSADSTGLDCLHNVCQRLGLQQSEFFGLRYMSKRPYPKVRWVELDRPLKKQLQKYAQSPALVLAVQYYIHDVGLLQDDVTRSHYFLQVKQDVLEGKLRCNYEQAVLLASYSLQAEFGDHQPERHTPEYLKDFKLFPKQAVNEGDVGSLLDAVVWQYSSLTGLAQALAETYYILEAQGLPGYGHETFIARDENGSEVYLGASLLGIVVQPASGESQAFYRWNAITNLINHRRTFGIECACSEQTVHFTFEEPDAAKYVWKMCVKQHTFYKGNQELLEGVGTAVETRSLAIPDLQSSVMASSFKTLHHVNTQPNHELVKGQTLGDLSLHDEQVSSRTFASSLPHLELSFIPKPTENGHLGTTLESPSQLATHESFNILSQSGFSLNNTRFSIKQHHQPQMQQQQQQPLPQQQPQQPQFVPQQQQQQQPPPPPSQQQQLQSAASSLAPPQQQQDASNLGFYPSNLNPPSARSSIRRALLPQYRPAPDYESALLHKYGPGVTMLYSSQPEISSPNKTDLNDTSDKDATIAGYNHYYGDPAMPRGSQQTPKSTGVHFTGTLHNTYSTPELAHVSYPEEDPHQKQKIDSSPLEYHFIHGYKPPPPYPYNKPSSNSTPDLASSSKDEGCKPDISARKRSLLTASLGCLGSPELSRTYENLTDLNDVVESLRKELTRSSKEGGTSFLHSFSPNLSRDDLDVIYQLSNGQVAVGPNLNLNASNMETTAGGGGLHIAQQNLSSYQQNFKAANASDEPIYQNVGSLLSSIPEDSRRDRTKSAPQLDGLVGRKESGVHNQAVLASRGVEESAARNRAVTHSSVPAHIAAAKQQQQQTFEAVNPIVNPLANSYERLQQQLQQQKLQQQQHHLKQHQQIQQQQQQQKLRFTNQVQHLQVANQFVPDKQPPNVDLSAQHSHGTPQMQQQVSYPKQQYAAGPPQVHKGLHLPKDSPSKGSKNPKGIHTQQQLQTEVLTKAGDVSDSKIALTFGKEGPISAQVKVGAGAGAHAPSQDAPKRPDVLLEVNTSLVTPKDSRVSELEKKLDSMDIVQEFDAIPRVKANADFASASRPESLSRNRYKDIIPYEENRVKIMPSKDNKAGYINASHITASVGDTQRFYICAQGPLPTTVAHFWQCVWETDVRLIVMLTSVIGVSASSKSFPYWPQTDNTSVECDQFRIYRKHSTKSSFHTTCRLQLVNVAQRKSRSVWHLQFTDWADHGCPEDTQGFINFLQELSTLRRVTYSEVEGVGRNRNTPVLVHCSAGGGRSGVTILCDLLIEAADHNLPIDPAKVLLHLRQQRMSLVQSLNQYKFVYMVLVSYLQKARLI